MFDLPDRMPDAEEAFDEGGQFAEGDLAGGVGDGLIRVGMRLEKDAIGSGGEGGAGEGGDEFALTAADAASRTGELHAVSGVDDSGVPALAMMPKLRMSTTRFW